MGLSKKNRYVACLDCGCRLEMNGICKICGHADEPLLPGIMPDVVGLTEQAASALITGPESQLNLISVETENSESAPIGSVIASAPEAGTELAIGAPVAIVVSLGPAG